MEPIPASQRRDEIYHPISKKYLRYLVEGLNDEDSGAGVFAQLAVRLLHRRKCANIVPATEPSSGGDYGQDARTQRVILDSEGRFRLYESPPLTPERWIFAFSINVNWKSKLQGDARKIIDNELHPDRIVFVTNQFVSPEHVKIDVEREISDDTGIQCEILDGQWILEQLYGDDYELAVDFLGCPPEQDPELMQMFKRIFGLKEAGLSEEEALELEKLKREVQYRNRYTDAPEHLIQDLRRIGDILAKYDQSIEEAINWYEEGLPELDRITILAEGIELLYSYFKALFKLPTGPIKIFNLLPKFIDLIIRSNARSLFSYISVWFHYLVPAMYSRDDFRSLYFATLERLRSIDQSQLGRLSIAYINETILDLELIPSIRQPQGASAWLEQVRAFLNSISSIAAFPVDHVADKLSALAPMLKDEPLFETCFELALELESKQEGGFHKANTLKQRAIAHQKAGQLHESIVVGSRAKLLWLNENSIRGFLLMSLALSDWYFSLKLYQAAEFELFEAIFIAISQPKNTHPDLLVTMFLQLAHIAIFQGRVLRCYRWLSYYYRLCHLHRVEVLSHVTERYLENDLKVILTRLYSANRKVHDCLVKILDDLDSNVLRSYHDIFLSSDDEFKFWLQDDELTEEDKTETKLLREKVLNGTIEPIEDWIDYDETQREQYISWEIPVPYQDLLSFEISYPQEMKFAQNAFMLAATLQIWLVHIHEEIHQFTVAEDRVKVTQALSPDSETDFIIGLTQAGDTRLITLTLSQAFLDKLATTNVLSVVDLFAHLSITIINDIILEPQDELMELLSPTKSNKIMDRFFMVAHPGYLWGNTPIVRELLQEEYAI